WYYILFIFFFFQAEDGIRDRNVTGVQTCALPILAAKIALRNGVNRCTMRPPRKGWGNGPHGSVGMPRGSRLVRGPDFTLRPLRRSEERRVGKEGRSRWARYGWKEKQWIEGESRE